jgi:hypothetical protein
LERAGGGAEQRAVAESNVKRIANANIFMLSPRSKTLQCQ